MKKFFNILNKRENKKGENGLDVFKNSRISFNSPIPKFTDLKIGEWSSCSNPLTIHAYHTSNLKLIINKFVHIGKNFKWLASKEHTPELISNNLNALFLNEEEFEKIYLKYHEDSPILEIGNDVWIGDNVIIIGTVKVGNGSVIGAGAVVTHNVEPYEVVAGNPQKHIKYRFDKNSIDKLNEVEWWDWSDKKIKTNINRFFNNDLLK
ncbi:MAG: CatB-related O-acetyltransferase [Candidatus Micrarchaeia archaeon]